MQLQHLRVSSNLGISIGSFLRCLKVSALEGPRCGIQQVAKNDVLDLLERLGVRKFETDWHWVARSCIGSFCRL